MPALIVVAVSEVVVMAAAAAAAEVIRSMNSMRKQPTIQRSNEIDRRRIPREKHRRAATKLSNTYFDSKRIPVASLTSCRLAIMYVELRMTIDSGRFGDSGYIFSTGECSVFTILVESAHSVWRRCHMRDTMMAAHRASFVVSHWKCTIEFECDKYWNNH